MTKNTVFTIRKIIAYIVAILLVALVLLLINYIFGMLYTTPSFTPVFIVSALIAFLQLTDTFLYQLSKRKT